jgi:signal peptidase I
MAAPFFPTGMSPNAGPRSPGRRRPQAAASPNSFLLLLRDVGIAALAVALVIGAVFAYAGTWPPMVVIESPSMQHANDRSFLGVIDTGDLTLVKKVSRDGDITTYMQGQRTGYQTYGTYGDVVIYAKNGHFELTPIIHRAITRIAYNASETNRTGVLSFDFPEIERPDRFAVRSDQVFDIGPVWTWHGAQNDGVGFFINLTVDLRALASSFAGNLSGFTVGFITKGDHNSAVDQGHLTVFSDRVTPTVEPVRAEWLVGEARGELPWFGAIKLASGRSPCPPSCTPSNTWTNLVVAIVVIAVGPFVMEKAWERYGDRVSNRVPATWRTKWHGAWDRLPGGPRRAERREARRLELEGIRKRSGGRRRGGRSW